MVSYFILRLVSEVATLMSGVAILMSGVAILMPEVTTLISEVAILAAVMFFRPGMPSSMPLALEQSFLAHFFKDVADFSLVYVKAVS